MVTIALQSLIGPKCNKKYVRASHVCMISSPAKIGTEVLHCRWKLKTKKEENIERHVYHSVKPLYVKHAVYGYV